MCYDVLRQALRLNRIIAICINANLLRKVVPVVQNKGLINEAHRHKQLYLYIRLDHFIFCEISCQQQV